MTRHIMLLASLVFAAQVSAIESFKITASGGSPIPTAYSTSDTQSKVKTGLRYKSQVCVYNSTASVIAINIDNGDSSTAPSADAKDIYVPASTGACAGPPVSSRVYLRSDSGSTITSGTVYGWAQ